MSAFTIDFSSAGLKEGTLKGLRSLARTMIAAGIAYLSLRLDNLHVANFVKPEYAANALVAVGGLHALLSFLGKWLTTTPVPATLGDGSVITA